ncbi:Aste57867_19941 [Aphanomyces stellatus]|uniref:Aste57867_19941 protein n=1 Tax=Aphanomyces stellatus TaxID=120398 RepID=A0A485LDP4_9STRA|nr:hypothetical protein As57867_019875 [Aphanomyces stellatus]VFT96638.1 Aste57867_19941 [Aphanomyces stellatus]
MRNHPTNRFSAGHALKKSNLMSRVAPDASLVPQHNDYETGEGRGTLQSLLCFLYVFATGIATVIYLVILAPNVSNDNLWYNMNTTGIQTFLGDLYNLKLSLGEQGPLDLFATSAVVRKDYSVTTTFISMRPASARAQLLSRLPLIQTIQVMRAVPLSENIQTVSQPCWADLTRTHEMARSVRHQIMCNERRVPNAAYYLEALFRNLAPNDLATSTYLPAIETSVFAFIQTTPGGTQWTHRMMAPVWTTLSNEVALWEAHGIAYFQNSFQNYYLEGTQESITIVNALGMRQSITINSFTATNRPKTQWSSAMSYTGFWNDIDACQWFQASLIRAAPNLFEHVYNMSWESWDFYFWGSIGTNGTAVLRSSLGPFTTFDVFLVQPPPSLLLFVSGHQNVINSALLHNAKDYLAISEPIVDVAPAAWNQIGAVYYGGNPICPYGIAQPYVQTSFGYYDDCGAQIQHTIQFTRDSIIFAMLATGIEPPALDSVCRMASKAAYVSCLQSMLGAKNVLDNLIDISSLLSLRRQATQDVVSLNTSFVQWASINGTNVALHQAMVSNTTWDPWSFVGWMTMYEWSIGQREVYAFEGDWDIWTLMSCHHDYVPLVANIVELPKHACQYLWIACTYVSVVLLCVMVLALVYGAFVAHFQVNGINFLFSNRLIGGSWIGRPFLFLRGVTAMLILATSPATFNNYSGFAKLDFTPRPWWHVSLFAGEVVWITYVIHDVLLPFTKPHSPIYAPLSSFFAWVAAMIIEFAKPYRATATINQKCTILSFTRGLDCTSGDIQIGNINRVGELTLLVVASVPLAFLFVRRLFTQKFDPTLQVPDVASFHLPGSSESFLRPPYMGDQLDVVACILSGLIPFGGIVFDIKNWIVFPIPRIGRSLYKFPRAAIDVRPASSAFTSSRRLQYNGIGRSLFKIRCLGVAGLLYMCCAVVSSFLYLFASQAYFTNDFLWVGFEDTHTQAFLSNWFNVQLQLANSTKQISIDDTAYGDYATTNQDTQRNIISSALYPILIQDEANTLINVIQGLRTMDSCYLPWIATAFCFADFDKTWEMAFSAERQHRCIQNEVTNGAVYLEAIVRNTNWLDLDMCWGQALESSIFSPIRTTNKGADWIHSVQTAKLELDDEIKSWQSHGIERFTTMWQNYKSLGVTESFIISNYAGLDYPVTLKLSNSSFHLSDATAIKMYSPFANYLIDVVGNRTFLSGKTLIRSTSAFAFQNMTPQDCLLENGLLQNPLDPAFLIFSSTVGPFGIVDVKRVVPPQELCALTQDIRKFLLRKLSSNSVIQVDFWAIYTQHFFLPQPASWDPPALMWGGDISCGLNYGGNTTFPLEYFSSNGLCGNYFWDYIKPLTQNLWMGILAMGSQNMPNATAVSFRDISHQSDIFGAITNSLALMKKHMTRSEIEQFDNLASVTKATLRDTINLELLQYLSVDGTSFFLSRVNIFAPTEQDFEFFAWIYVFEWAEGKREVISLHGAYDTLTTISTTKPLMHHLTDTNEVPLNVGRFFSAVIFYVTSVLFGVGCLVTMYIVSSFGYVDGFNVMAFNYVAGHVWIGRPLILLRSLTSIAVLSTSQLKLHTSKGAATSYFQSPPRDVLTTLLSSSEICWLVYVFVDTFSVVTQEYTSLYSFPSALIVGVSVAIWSLAAPTTHSVSLSRQCTVVAVDFDVSCISGVVRIGDFNRFGGLIGIACGGCVVAYITVRYVRRRPPRFPPLSPLLYSAAKTKFEYTTHVNWEYEGVYYLDKASAAMTGILTLTYCGVEYIADIKTWRVYELSRHDRTAQLMPPQFRRALPLDSASIDTLS